MKEIERRLAALEKKINRDDTLNPETLTRVMHSPIFFIARIAEKDKLGRELTIEDEINLAVRLYECGKFSFTVKDYTDLVIAVDKEIEEEEKIRRLQRP